LKKTSTCVPNGTVFDEVLDQCSILDTGRSVERRQTLGIVLIPDRRAGSDKPGDVVERICGEDCGDELFSKAGQRVNLIVHG
jgi:hypothetical protein